MDTTNLRINAERFKANFESLSQIGATVEGGVHRPTFSPEHFKARSWFQEQVDTAGLKFSIDQAGNHSAVLECSRPDSPNLLLGSHLDSVPQGGRYDGAIGVLSALEVLQTVQETGLNLPVNLEAIDFTDEEGTLIGLMGSSAVAGKLTQDNLLNPRGGREALLSGLKEAGLSEEGLLRATRDPKLLAGYLEVHIEQGNRLIEANAHIGIVTSIIGLGSYWITYIGRPDHAGTTPIQARLDASLGASAFTLAVREMILKEFPNCVANIGKINLTPAAFNIVPETAKLALEFRAPDKTSFEKLETALLDQAKIEADGFGLEVEYQFLGKKLPAQMHESTQNALFNAAKDLGLQPLPLISYAGHDAQSLASLCPAGMVFIPSVNGTSHSPLEYTKWEECVNGANVLLQAALNVAKDF